MSTQIVCDNCKEIVTGSSMSGEHRINRNQLSADLKPMFFQPIKFDWCTSCSDVVLRALKQAAKSS